MTTFIRLSLFLILCSLAIQSTRAQWFLDIKRDYQWITGKGFAPPPTNGGVGLDFNGGQVNSFVLNHPLFLRGASGAICDTSGHLIAFTNGFQVANRLGSLMPHGDSINFGWAWINYIYYNPTAQGMIILPRPGDENKYFMLHLRINYIQGEHNLAEALLYSVLDMDQQNGLGDVTEKNVPVIEDTLNLDCLTACRHGNGRDWWLLIPEFNHAAYYRVLVDPEGVHLMGKQYIGQPCTQQEQGWCCFSPDGNYFAQVGDSIGQPLYPVRVNLFHFDRCQGLLSDFHDLGGWIMDPDDLSFLISACFSPNSRYLYINTAVKVYQFDLQAADIPGSRTTVAVWDSTYWPAYPFNPCMFSFMQLAPDGKIYIPAYASPYVHVINYPDLPGLACQVVQRQITLPRVTYSFPNYPNFRLGRWEGSPCDNLYTGIEDKEKAKETLKVFPNPARDEIQIDVGQITAGMPSTLEIYSLLSGKLEEIPVSPFQGMVKWNVSHLPNGMYSFVLKSDGNILGTGKFAVIR